MKPSTLALLSVFVTLATGTRASSAQEDCQTPRTPGEAAANLEHAIERSRQFAALVRGDQRKPGLAVAVGIEGEIVWSEGLGVADLETGAPITPESLFRVGSVSKVLTAAAVALLDEEGRLDLDAPIREYVPEFPDKGHVITTRQLCAHLSGVRHYTEEENAERRYAADHYESVLDALELFAASPLLFPPGTDQAYSSYAWTLVSAVVERAGGSPFLQLMKERVFDPLGMSQTRADDLTADIPGRVSFYDHGGPAPRFDPSYCWAGAGFLSTVEDLVRFGSAYLPGGSFLDPETLALVFTNQTTSDGEPVPHGIGWFVDELDDGNPVYWHGGEIIGGRAVLLVRPVGGIVVAMLANTSGGFGPTDANIIADEFLGTRTRLVGWSADQARSRQNTADLQAMVQGWIEALNENDVEAVMERTSDSFTSDAWSHKAALREALESAARVDRTSASAGTHLRIRGREAGALSYLDGVTMKGPFHTGTVSLCLVLEEHGWKVVGIRDGDGGGFCSMGLRR